MHAGVRGRGTAEEAGLINTGTHRSVMHAGARGRGAERCMRGCEGAVPPKRRGLSTPGPIGA